MVLQQGLIFAIITLLGWGASKVVVKPAIRSMGPYNALFYEHLFVALALALFSSPFIDLVMPGTGILLLLAGAMIVGALAVYSLFRAFDIGKLSITAPIAQSATIFTVLLSYFIYEEQVSLLQALAIVLLIIGVIMISFRYSDLKRIRVSRAAPGAGFAALTMVGWGLYYFMIKPVVIELGPLLSVVYLEVGILVMIALPLLLGKARVPDRTVCWTFFSGILVALAAWAFNMGIMRAPVSIIHPVANSSVLVTVLLSRLFLKERIETNQKAAIFLIITGLIFISI